VGGRQAAIDAVKKKGITGIQPRGGAGRRHVLERWKVDQGDIPGESERNGEGGRGHLVLETQAIKIQRTKILSRWKRTARTRLDSDLGGATTVRITKKGEACRYEEHGVGSWETTCRGKLSGLGQPA